MLILFISDLEQNFTASRQNEIWVSDIAYFKIKDYGVYLYAIIDLFSRKVVGYRVSQNVAHNWYQLLFERDIKIGEIPLSLRSTVTEARSMFPGHSTHC